MAVNYFNGSPDDNLRAALNEEIPYPKWVVSYNNGAEVYCYNENDQPPSDEEVAANNGVKTFYEFDTRE